MRTTPIFGRTARPPLQRRHIGGHRTASGLSLPKPTRSGSLTLIIVCCPTVRTGPRWQSHFVQHLTERPSRLVNPERVCIYSAQGARPPTVAKMNRWALSFTIPDASSRSRGPAPAVTRPRTSRTFSPPWLRNISLPMPRNPWSKGGRKGRRPSGADHRTTKNFCAGRYGHNPRLPRSAGVPASRICGRAIWKPWRVRILTPCGHTIAAAPTRPWPSIWPSGPARIANVSAALWRSQH